MGEFCGCEADDGIGGLDGTSRDTRSYEIQTVLLEHPGLLDTVLRKLVGEEKRTTSAEVRGAILAVVLASGCEEESGSSLKSCW